MSCGTKVCVWFKSDQQMASQGCETYKTLKKVTLTISKSKAGTKAAQDEHVLNSQRERTEQAQTGPGRWNKREACRNEENRKVNPG